MKKILMLAGSLLLCAGAYAADLKFNDNTKLTLKGELRGREQFFMQTKKTEKNGVVTAEDKTSYFSESKDRSRLILQYNQKYDFVETQIGVRYNFDLVQMDDTFIKLNFNPFVLVYQLNADELAIEGANISYSPNTTKISYTLDAKNYINNLNTGVYDKKYNTTVFFGTGKEGLIGNTLTANGDMSTGLRAEYSLFKELTAKVGFAAAMDTPKNDEKVTPNLKKEITNVGIKTALEYKADSNNLINLQFVYANGGQKITTGSSIGKDASGAAINIAEAVEKSTNGYIGLGSYAKTNIPLSKDSSITLEAEGMFTSRNCKVEKNDVTASEISITDFGTYVTATYTIGMFNPYVAVQANYRNVEDKNPGSKDKTLSEYTYTSIMPGVDIVMGNLTYRLECQINTDKDDQKQANVKYEGTQIVGFARVKYKF